MAKWASPLYCSKGFSLGQQLFFIQGKGPLERSRTIGYDENKMTHEYAGHYRTKHAPNIQMNSNLAKLLRQKAMDGHLSCASAFAIARETSASPAEVGQSADLLEIRITACQLGLFTYMKEKRNIVEPAERISKELEQALRKATVNGRLPCKEAWDIAERFSLSKMEITAACERLGTRFSRCQLGTF